MPFNIINDVRSGSPSAVTDRASHPWLATGTAVLAAVLCLLAAGCASSGPAPKSKTASTTTPAPMAQPAMASTNEAPATPMVVLKEGDSIKIEFPSTDSLNETVVIRQDGLITLMGGKPDFHAAGLTPAELRAKLLDIYEGDIAVKEVTVTVLSSAFPIYIQGAVLKAGKITPDHPVTVLDALNEAGGWDPVRANLKKVKIVRQQGASVQTFILDIQKVIDGKKGEPFQLKPGDIIIVPERFVWF